MAEREKENDDEQILQNIDIVGLHSCVTHILKKCGSQSRLSVMNELVELEAELLKESRLLLFSRSKECYEEQLAQLSIKDEVKIEPKNRRKIDNTTGDIVDLYLYVIGVREDFPRHVLKDVSVYRDISLVSEENNEESQDETDEIHEDGDGPETGKDQASVQERSDVSEAVANAETPEKDDTTDDDKTPVTDTDTPETVESSPPVCDHPDGKNCNDKFAAIWKYVKAMERRILTLEKPKGKQSSDTDEPSPPINESKKDSRNTSKNPAKSSEKTPSSEEFDDFGFDPGASSSGTPAPAPAKPKENEPSSKSGGGRPPPLIGKKSAPERKVDSNKDQNAPPSPIQKTNSSSKSLSGGVANKFPNKSKKPLSTAQNPKGRTVELYLPNITKHPDDSLRDVAERVRHHAKTRGLHVVTSRIITNKFSSNTVGCHITVPERQQDDALGNRVWPDGMKCRRWTDRSSKNGVGSRQFISQDHQRYNYRQRQQEHIQDYRGGQEYYRNSNAVGSSASSDHCRSLNGDYHYYYDDDHDEYEDPQENQYYNSWEDRYEHQRGTQ